MASVMLTYYLWKRSMQSLLLVTIAFAALIFLLELEQEAGRSNPDGNALHPTLLALLKVPESLFALLPIVVLLAALNTSLRLARSNEIASIQGTGMAGRNAVIRMALFAGMFGIVVVAAVHPVVVMSTQLYNNAVGNIVLQDDRVHVEGSGFLWVREALEDSVVIMRLKRNPATGEFVDVAAVTFDADNVPKFYMHALHAEPLRNGWLLRDVNRWLIGDEIENVEATRKALEEYRIQSSPSAQELVTELVAAENVHIWALLKQWDVLERAGLKLNLLHIHVLSLCMLPLVFATMTMLGGAGALKPSRMLRIPLVVIAAIIAGLMVFFLRNLTQILGTHDAFPVVSAILTVPVGTLLLACAAVFYAE